MNIKQQRMIGIQYSIGQISTLVLELMAAYGVFFMTTTKLMDATVSSSIISIATIVATIAGLYIAYAIDKSKKSKGTVAFTFLIPTLIAFCLFFLPVNFSGGANTAYMAVMAILFYSLYYCFLTPFDALGGDLVSDYNVRTFTRTLCMVMLYVGVLFADTLSTFVRSWFTNAGMTDGMSWFLMVIIMSAVSLLAGIFAWAATKKVKVEAAPVTDAPAANTNIFKSYMQTLKIKPVLVIVIWSIFYYIVNMLLSPMILYLGVYVMGLSQTVASTFYTVSIITTIIISPAVAGIASKIGKQKALVFGSFVYLLFVIYAQFKMPTTYIDGVFYCVTYSIVNVIAQSCSYSMLYDASEVAEFRTGRAKMTECMGLYKAGMAIGVAIGTFALGQVLAISGFDGAAEVQSEATIHGMVIGSTIFPGIILIISALIIAIFYKINEKNHAALAEALEKKRNGEEYSTDGFKELL